MNTEISAIIRKLSQQVNVDAIETKDLVKELETLYTKIETMEKTIETKDQTIISLNKLANEATEKLADFTRTFVTPADTLRVAAEKLEREQFEFNIEKKWMKQDRDNMLQIVRMLTARFNSSSQDFSNGSMAHSESHNWEKPDLK